MVIIIYFSVALGDRVLHDARLRNFCDPLGVLSKTDYLKLVAVDSEYFPDYMQFLIVAKLHRWEKSNLLSSFLNPTDARAEEEILLSSDTEARASRK